jgi:hypothetical protein
MLDGNYQVSDVLMLVGNVAPVALYFLVLGLVNSHARPFLITSRSDFIALTTVLVPVLLWPVPVFARSGMWWPLGVGSALAACVFVWLLRTTGDGFVIYNISEARCARLLDHTLRHLGLVGRWDGATWRSDVQDLSIHLRKFPLLRNVSLHIESSPERGREIVDALGVELDQRLAAVAQLPSTMGAALVMIGVGLMLLPMWMVGRHIHDLVDAMSHLFG